MDIQKILYRCERNSTFSARLVDELLVPLFEEETGTGAEFSKRLLREYGHAVEELPQAWHLGVREQFNAYKLFGKEGLAKDLLNHPKIRSRTKGEGDYLSSQVFRPWRYAFIRVLEDLGNDLFTVINLFSQEEFLLYSPGIAQYEAEGSHSMYLTLLSDNGLCKQTYGPIAYFRGLQPAEVLFYARWVLKENLADFAALEEMINENPLHFVVLFIGGNFPLTTQDEDILVVMQSELKLSAVEHILF